MSSTLCCKEYFNSCLDACVLPQAFPGPDIMKPMGEFGKLLIFLGAVMIVVGVMIVLLGRTHLPIGKLPGDIVYRGKNTTVYFPLATCLLLSIVLSVVLYAVSRWKR
jgi:hypothetical protein